MNPQESTSRKPHIETSEPENNLIERHFSKLFYLIGAVVKESRNRHLRNSEDTENTNVDARPHRSLLLRRIRREILKSLQGTKDKDKRKSLIQEAHERDRIAAESLTQYTVSVDLGELGTQESRFIHLKHPEIQSDSEKPPKNLPPVFLIPGISNDIDPVGGLAQELAYSGREVFVIAYPESTLGKISPEFAESVTGKADYSDHATYFGKAIETLVQEHNLNEYELWSHSTGGPIVATILKGDAAREKVKNAVFLAPASAVEQTKASLVVGVLKEMKAAIRNIPLIAKFSLVMPAELASDEDTIQQKLKSTVTNKLLENVCQKYPDWNDIQVADGGSVIFWSGARDTITRSGDNPQLGSGENQHAITDTNALHHTVLVDSVRVITQIDAVLASKKIKN